MSDKTTIGGIGVSSNGVNKSFGKLDEKEKEKYGLQTAYMGPNIGNILNGSSRPQDASAVRG